MSENNLLMRCDIFGGQVELRLDEEGICRIVICDNLGDYKLCELSNGHCEYADREIGESESIMEMEY